MFTETFTYEASQTDLYAYPASGSHPFADWATHRVLASEVAPGLYSVTMDESKSPNWSVFDGSAQPTSHDDAIVSIRYEAPPVTTGTGARSVTATVTLASLPLQGATVRLSKGAESYISTTNASGQVVFNVNDGTWQVAITAANASFAGASLVVDGDETPTYALSQVSIPPSSSPDAATGFYTCIDGANAPEQNIQVCVQLIAGPGQAGYTYNSPVRKAVSGSDGLVSFPNLVRGATYRAWRGYTGQSDDSVTFIVPATGASFAMPELL